MTATDVLRHMLDERGVEWEEFDDFEPTTWWSTHNGAFAYWARERDGKLLVETTAPTKCSASCTPAQAIAATLGTGTCEITDNGPWGYPYVCSACGASFDPDVNNGEFNYCPNCGRRIEQ